MKDLSKFIRGKIIDCENVFENANATTDQVFFRWITIGKRQAYSEVLDFIMKNG